ncbi:MAG: hypothetical protein AAF211_30565 [Myxococcota bacterium]
MGERRSRLGSRFKRAVEKAEDAREQGQRSAQEAERQARLARAELFADLESLGKEIGVLTVQRTKQGLTLRYRERYLHFAPDGIGDVVVEFEGTGDDVHRLYREAELGDRWVHHCKRRFRDLRVPLFDQGIEDLLVDALGLPRPDDEPDPEPGPTDDGPPRRL